MRVAALDLGSNSFLCLIADGEKGQIQNVVIDESRVVKLAQGLEASGELHPDALARAEKVLVEFKALINQYKPEKVEAVATAAVREARNSKVFLELLKKYNIPLKILSGHQEAETSFNGAFSDIADQGEQILIDIGGGSTEIIWGRKKNILWSHSFPIGVVKLTERYIHKQPVDLKDLAEIQGFLRTTFIKLKELDERLSLPQLRAVAGTPTTLAGILVGGYDSKKVDGFKLTKEHLKEWTRTFAGMSVSEKEQKFKIGARAETILAGCILLEYLRNYFGQNEITVSIRGVRYGIANKLLQ